jgi:hypothetical protein
MSSTAMNRIFGRSSAELAISATAESNVIPSLEILFDARPRGVTHLEMIEDVMQEIVECIVKLPAWRQLKTYAKTSLTT